MKKSDIYQNQSLELLRLFEEAGNSGKVMCVPIDYAKSDHTVMFCSGVTSGEKVYQNHRSKCYHSIEKAQLCSPGEK